MAYRVRTVRDSEEHARAVGSIAHYFGHQPTPEDAERFSRILPHERLHAIFDGTTIVGGAGAYPFEMTIPGGPVPCAGISVVGVLPTHRRRGLLRRMMTTQLADVRERGEPIASLWASEETIYGRYGYGMASLNMAMKLPRVRAGLRADLPPPTAEARLVDHDEAMRVFPRVYDTVRPVSPGFVSRTPAWWELRALDDQPERRRGGGPLNRVLLERDGRPVGFALYRMVQEWAEFKRTLRVIEAFGVDAAATRDVVRFLLSVDWLDDITWRLLPVDHPVKLLVSRLSELGLSVGDGLWMRLVDVGAALSARSSRPTAGSRSRSSPTRSWPTTLPRGRWQTGLRSGRAGDLTSGSTYRRSAPPSSAASRSSSSRGRGGWRRRRAEASHARMRCSGRTALPGVRRSSRAPGYAAAATTMSATCAGTSSSVEMTMS